MYLSIIVIPLAGTVVAGLFGRKIGIKGSHFITCISVIITTLLAILAFIEIAINNIPVSLYLFKWIDTESLNVIWGFNFDSLTVSMLIPVLIVSSLVHLYSIGYMSHDPHQQRFFSYLSLFTFMMIILVTANNYLFMFVGWEGVGICSYLLVNFWFTRIAANQSSISAILTNRVGDCFLTIGMFAILWGLGNLDYATVFSLAPYINENIVTFIGICLLIGAMAKSSQIGRVKALKKWWYDSPFFWILIYAGKVSNALESVGLIDSNNISPEKSPRQVTNQQGINKYDEKFLEWFIGFTEGDGSFVTTKGKSLFSIHLHIVDLPLLYYIKTELNMGNIYTCKNSCIYIIKANKEVNNIINIFNGNIYLNNRKTQFANWLYNFNQKNKSNIQLLKTEFKPSLSDNWLAGFIDAEGSFLVSVTKKKIIQRFVLGQKDAQEEFVYLSILLNGYTEKLKNHDRLVINFLKLDILINYLNNHKLYSIKEKSLIKWLNIYYIRLNQNSPLDIAHYNTIKKKASLINSLRKSIKL